MQTARVELQKYVCKEGHTHQFVGTPLDALKLTVKGICPTKTKTTDIQIRQVQLK